MSDFRYRPKDKYIEEADWQKLYVLTEHWQSDLAFYADDLKFLQHLIDKYFLWLSKKENIDLVREIEVSLIQVDKQCEALQKRVKKHLHHLAELIDDPFVYDSHEFRAEHQKLEDDIVDFIKNVREQRKETFSITDYVIEHEEFLKHIG